MAAPLGVANPAVEDVGLKDAPLRSLFPDVPNLPPVSAIILLLWMHVSQYVALA